MKQERYEHVTNSSDSFEFKFISVGPKGEIAIVVEFRATEDSNVVTLAFGNLMRNGEIDDLVRNDNKDRNKILATVAAIVYEFTSKYPEKFVYFSGSTDARTRLYRMAITVNLEELLQSFRVFGISITDSEIKTEEFKNQTFYNGFAVQRKKY